VRTAGSRRPRPSRARAWSAGAVSCPCVAFRAALFLDFWFGTRLELEPLEPEMDRAGQLPFCERFRTPPSCRPTVSVLPRLARERRSQGEATPTAFAPRAVGKDRHPRGESKGRSASRSPCRPEPVVSQAAPGRGRRLAAMMRGQPAPVEMLMSRPLCIVHAVPARAVLSQTAPDRGCRHAAMMPVQARSPRMRRASWTSLGMMVTRLPWMAQRLVSSNRPTR